MVVYEPFAYPVGDSLDGIDGATGKDLTKLTKSSANPIVPISTDASAWDAGATGKRSSIVKEGEFYYFAFEGRTPLPDSTARWSPGLARSSALTSGWTKCRLNPLIPTTPGYFGYDAPELLHHRHAWLLYVRSPGANATHVFKLASDRRTPPVLGEDRPDANCD